MRSTTVKAIVWIGLSLATTSLLPGAARAGWVVEWKNTAIKRGGDRMPSERATMYIAKNRVRLEQPTMTTLSDYDEGRFTVLNPERRFFWSGRVEDYVREITRRRGERARRRSGPGAALNYGPRKIDEDSLPRIVLKKKPEQGRDIAGYRTVKYEIHSNGELFQELWLAEALDTSADLEPEKFLQFQRKMSAGMLGRSAGPFNALYRSKDYAELLRKGFILRSVVHHIAGGFEREATAVRRSDVPASLFAPPKDFRRVRLGDVFPKPERQVTPGAR